MTINNRIKEIRLSLKKSQTEFARILGVKQAMISAIETGSRNVTDRNINLLHDKLDVNEDFLRSGTGPMFQETASFSLDDLAKKKNVSERGIKIVKCFLEMPKELREPLLDYIEDYFHQDSIIYNHLSEEKIPLVTEHIK